jgi:predicted nucleic acid-binding protein
MAERFVAADASPLIGLAAAGAFELLRGLFGTVVVAAAVRDEVLAGGIRPGAEELRNAIESGWIRVVRTPADKGLFPELGAGEAGTLMLALKRGSACLVLMDDPLGRAQAHARGIAVTGLAGVLLAAKRARLVRRIRPLFERLAESDFRISSEVVRAVLEAAGEAG